MFRISTCYIILLFLFKVAAAQEHGIIALNNQFIHVEPAVAVHPANPNLIIVTSMVFEEDNPNAMVVIYRSSNRGKDWEQVYLSNSTNFVGDPWVGFLDEHTVLVSCLNLDEKGAIGILRSSDGGLTWKKENSISKFDGRHYDHPVFIKSTESLIFSASQGRNKDRLYSYDARTLFMDFNLQVDTTLVHSSAAIDFTTGNPALFQNNTVLVPMIEIGDNSKGYQEIIDTPMLYIKKINLLDYSFKIHKVAKMPGMGSFPSLAADQTRIFLTRHVIENNKRKLFLWSSQDAGVNWETINVELLTNRDAEVRNPMVQVNASGTLGLLWAEISNNDCVDIKFASSEDHGNTFSTIKKLNNTPSCNHSIIPDAYKLKNGRSLFDRYQTGGDYYGFCANDDTFLIVYPLVKDGRFQLHYQWLQP